MKILVITRNAWDDTNAIGNTLSNFFNGVEDIEVANVYFRSASPNNKICKKYFCITETEVLKKWFSPKKIGKQFDIQYTQDVKAQTLGQKNEKAMINIIRNNNLKFAYFLSNCIWYSKKWQNQRLSDFIESFQPDFAVTFVKSSPQYYLMTKYLREKYKLPILSWIADDEYTSFKKENKVNEINNLKYIINESAAIRGCSKPICDYYNSIFGCDATPLYKGCDLSQGINTVPNETLKLIYSGNTLYGRMGLLKHVAAAVEEYGASGHKISFEIYTNTSLTNDDISFFAEKKYTKYQGSLGYDELKKRLASADIVLHVESFEKEHILKTKYSFSTKIIDYLQSGAVILAVGPKELASIDYVSNIPGSYVIYSENELKFRLDNIFEESKTFYERKKLIREFAVTNHDCITNCEKIKCLFKYIKNI